MLSRPLKGHRRASLTEKLPATCFPPTKTRTQPPPHRSWIGTFFCLLDRAPVNIAQKSPLPLPPLGFLGVGRQTIKDRQSSHDRSLLVVKANRQIKRGGRVPCRHGRLLHVPRPGPGRTAGPQRSQQDEPTRTSPVPTSNRTATLPAGRRLQCAKSSGPAFLRPAPFCGAVHPGFWSAVGGARIRPRATPAAAAGADGDSGRPDGRHVAGC